MPVSSAVKLSVAGVVGAIFLGVGVTLHVIFPRIVASKIKQSLPIVEGSDLFKAWEEAPIPIYMQYYFFNITNADDYYVNHSKPILQQLGPYTYREYRKKVNISFNLDEDTVTYEQLKWFVFEPDMSGGSLDDEIITINLPIFSVGHKSEGLVSGVKKAFLNNAIKKDPLFIRRTIDELLFGGYWDETMVNLGKRMNKELLPNGTFSYMGKFNYTADGVYTVYTGVKNFDNFPGISAWNGNSSLSYWEDEYCDRINGTDGSTFKPFLNRQTKIKLFSTDLCRSVFMTYDEDGEVHGIKTFRYSTPYELLADSTQNPDNECFCQKQDTCLLSGLLNVSVCKEGAPLVVSPVHFYQSDPSYIYAVEGLNPDKMEHDTLLDVEPTTGVVVRAARRIQINVALRPLSHIKKFSNLTNLILPIFWVNESANIGYERAELFRGKIYKPVLIGKAVTYALLAIGGFILVLTIIFAIRACTQKQNVVISEKKIPVPLYEARNSNHYVNNEANESLLKPAAF